jgi:early secretory antigenic target protein ESAT-6
VSDQIKVTFAQIQATQERAQSTVASINSSLQDLKSYLAPMVSTWEGQAAQNYHAKQTQWDRAAYDLNQVLSAIGRALGSANEGFQNTESMNARRFA